MPISFAGVHVSVLRLPESDASGAVRFAALGIPTSDKLTGLEVRLSKVEIVDNGTTHVWPFIRYSDLYAVVVVIDDLAKEPNTLRVEGYANIDDGETLPLDRTIYYWKQRKASDPVPGQIHFLVSIVKSKQGIRNFGKALTKLRASDDFKTVVSGLVKAIASGGTSIPYDALLELTGVIGSVLGEVEDTPLFTWVQSFTDINGSFDALGRHRVSQGNRHVRCEATLTVRDPTREPEGKGPE